MTPDRPFAEQLAPVMQRLRWRAPQIRPVSQVVLELRGESSEAVFRIAQQHVLKWIENRAGKPLPQDAWDGKSFRMEDVGTQFAAAVSLDIPQYWAARLDDDDKSIARRTWVTEVGLAPRNADAVLLGVRLQCITRGDDAPFISSVPVFVRRLASEVSVVLDGRVQSLEPWIVENAEDVDELVSLIEDNHRAHDLLVFSLPENSDDIRDSIIDPQAFLDRVFGAAHVVVLTGLAAFHLTDRIGKELSVFQCAVRTYRAGFNLETNEPSLHPLALARRIEDIGPEAFTSFLIEETLRRTITVADPERYVPSFATVRQRAAEEEQKRAREEGASEAELLELALDENDELQKALANQKEEFDSLLSISDTESEQYRQAAEEVRTQLASLRARLEYLMQGSPQLQQSEEEPNPDSLDDFEVWAQINLAGSVVIHSRALRAVRKSDFENVALVYDALRMLRDYYVPMRRFGGDYKEKFEKRCQELSLDYSKTFSGSRFGEGGDAYFVAYAGQKRFLEVHLKGSSSREPRYGFRLYFFWDEGTEQAVVGWLPSHLQTRIT